jgi:magnesium transporter
MVNTYSYKNVTWVDLECPTRDEVRDLIKKYDIHPLAAEELLLPTTRSKVDRYDDFIYLILHFPAWKHSHRDATQEVDFIIGKNFIVTARYDAIDSLHKFAKMFEVNSILAHNKLIGEHGGYMFYYMIREIYHSLYDELEAVRDRLGDIEKKTFTGREKEMVYEISNTSRELLAFRHATVLHREVLESFAAESKSFFGNDFSHYMETIRNEYLKVDKTIASLSDSLAEMRQTNNSLLETKQNEIMKKFTAITIISSFLTIISSWFLVESPDRPFEGSKHEFWIIGGVMVIVALLIASIMKKKKWL